MTWTDSPYDYGNPFEKIDEQEHIHTEKETEPETEIETKETIYPTGSVSKILQDRDNQEKIGNLIGASVILGALYLVYRRFS